MWMSRKSWKKCVRSRWWKERQRAILGAGRERGGAERERQRRERRRDREMGERE